MVTLIRDPSNSRHKFFTLTWESYVPPPNDDFANASVLTGPAGSVQGSNGGATNEPGEPADHMTDPQGDPSVGASVWYMWTAPAGESSGWMDFRVADMVLTAGRPISTALRLLLGQSRLLALPRARIQKRAEPVPVHVPIV